MCRTSTVLCHLSGAILLCTLHLHSPPLSSLLSKHTGSSPSSRQHLMQARPEQPAPITATRLVIVSLTESMIAEKRNIIYTLFEHLLVLITVSLWIEEDGSIVQTMHFWEFLSCFLISNSTFPYLCMLYCDRQRYHHS